MTKSIGIIQSSYIPWKGYFDLIRSVDVFVVLDSVQYTRRDWRNRNRIKTQQGLSWLTIPVQVKGRFSQTIAETQIDTSSRWTRSHWRSICQNYSKAQYFEQYRNLFEDLYEQAASHTLLSAVNLAFLKQICSLLNIKTEILLDSDLPVEDVEDPSERLVYICQSLGGSSYLSGPSAKTYLNVSLFSAHDIEVHFMDYSGYPEYPQPPKPFEHAVSIIDLIFHTGPSALQYMKKLGNEK